MLGYALAYPVKILGASLGGVAAGIVVGCAIGYNIATKKWWGIARQHIKNSSLWTIPTGIVFGATFGVVGLVARGLYDLTAGFICALAPLWREGYNHKDNNKLGADLRESYWQAEKTVVADADSEQISKTTPAVRRPMAVIGHALAYPAKIIAASICGIVDGVIHGWKVGYNIATKSSWKAAWQQFKDNSNWAIPTGIVLGVVVGVGGIIWRALSDLVGGLCRGFSLAFKSGYNKQPGWGKHYNDQWSKWSAFGVPALIVSGVVGFSLGLACRGIKNYCSSLIKHPVTTLLLTLTAALWVPAVIIYKAFNYVASPVTQLNRFKKDKNDFGSFTDTPGIARRLLCSIPIIGKILSKISRSWAANIPKDGSIRGWKGYVDSVARWIMPPKYNKGKTQAALCARLGFTQGSGSGSGELGSKLDRSDITTLTGLFIDTLLDLNAGQKRLSSTNGRDNYNVIDNANAEDAQGDNIFEKNESTRILKYLYNLFRSGHFNDHALNKHSQWRNSTACCVGQIEKLLPLEKEESEISLQLGNYTLTYQHDDDKLTITTTANPHNEKKESCSDDEEYYPDAMVI